MADTRHMSTTATTISSNHYSVDQQAVDAMSFLEHHHPSAYSAVIEQFPEWGGLQFADWSSWFDTEAMGVDVEWGSWLVDAIEDTGFVFWEDGEPWGYVTD